MQAKNRIEDVANRAYFGGPTFLVLAETGIGLGVPPPVKIYPGCKMVGPSFGGYHIWNVLGRRRTGCGGWHEHPLAHRNRVSSSKSDISISLSVSIGFAWCFFVFVFIFGLPVCFFVFVLPFGLPASFTSRIPVGSFFIFLFGCMGEAGDSQEGIFHSTNCQNIP